MVVSVVGGGPCGLYCSYLLARNGFSVKLFERKKQVGLPVQCTGLLTKEIFSFIRKSALDEFLVNKTDNIEVISKNNSARISSKEYIIDRFCFDNYLKELAGSEGVKLELKSEVKGVKPAHKKGGLIRLHLRKRPVFSDYVIGADGPLSSVSRFCFPEYKQETVLGNQVVAEGKFDDSTFSTYLGSNFSGFFGWVVPENRASARIGYAGKFTNDAVRKLLGFCNARRISSQAGLIPVFDYHRPISRTNALLVGDAGGFVKNTTGGGIVSGLESSKLAVKSIIGQSSFSHLTLKLRFRLLMHSFLRDVLNTFSDRDYDSLVDDVKKKSVRNVLKGTSRDTPIKLLAKLGVSNPSFLKYSAKLPRLIKTTIK